MTKTERILQVLCTYKKPDTVIRTLLDDPANSDSLIEKLLNEYYQSNA